eukprot:SAG22_NODE_1081_length_5654_cov_4.719352_3_plen_76_part_00
MRPTSEKEELLVTLPSPDKLFVLMACCCSKTSLYYECAPPTQAPTYFASALLVWPPGLRVISAFKPVVWFFAARS